MIGYVCKYTPVELMTSMGARMVRLEPEAADFTRADMLMHPNVCSYAKAVLEEMDRADYEGLILTTCCDSIRRLYDTLKAQYPDRFIWLLDIPRKVNDFAVGLYEERIRRMAEAYAAFSGNVFDERQLSDEIRRMQARAGLKGAPAGDGVRLGLIGARCPKSLRALLASRDVRLVYDLTCTGADRDEMLALSWPVSKTASLLHDYAQALLNQMPCLRMVRAVDRERFIDGMMDEVDGILDHQVKFCDIYAFEYARLHREHRVPVLKVETDLSAQCEGQIRTRTEAFLESLGKDPSDGRQAGKGGAQRMDGSETYYVLGIDSGSTSTNGVIMDSNRRIVADATLRTGAKSSDSARKVMQICLESAGLAEADLKSIVATGYGRVSVPFADRQVTEISCHGRGAVYLNPDVRTILDIGGQDSKAIRINERGEVLDFVMNDKCAAGTGRFLEAMARTLEIGLEEMGSLSLKSEKDVEISSMCTVFAESEVISLIAADTDMADIAAGVHRSVASKAWSLLCRVHPEPVYMMTGGVARNAGVVQAVSGRIKSPLYISEKPDLAGAIGAALYALEAIG